MKKRPGNAQKQCAIYILKFKRKEVTKCHEWQNRKKKNLNFLSMNITALNTTKSVNNARMIANRVTTLRLLSAHTINQKGQKILHNKGAKKY